MHLKIGLNLWILFIRIKRGASVVQPFGLCLGYGIVKKFFKWLNASHIRRRTVLYEGRGEEKEILHLKIVTAG